MVDSSTYEMVENIIGRPPSWLIRYGIGLIMLTFLSLLGMSWFIQYPDKITSSAIITSDSPPTELMSHRGGRIVQLFSRDGDTISKDQPLLLLRSNADLDQILSLESTLQKITHNVNELESIKSNFHYTTLGSVERSFRQFEQAMSDLLLNSERTALEKKIQFNRNLQEQYRSSIRVLSRKLKTERKKAIVAKSTFQSNKTLLDKGLLTSLELMPFENQYLNQVALIDEIELQIVEQNIKIERLQQENFELNNKHELAVKSFKEAVLQEVSATLIAIKEWKSNYLIVSPESGVLAYHQIWSEGQYIEPASLIANILRSTSQLKARLKVAHHGIGKVKVGQKVSLLIAEYPAQEFGKLWARVSKISLLADRSGYIIEANLDKILLTDQNKELAYVPNMQAEAAILTNEKRLLTRLISGLVNF